MQPENPLFQRQSSQRKIIRVRTITNLRWFAIFGQISVILLVRFGLGYGLPMVPMFGVIFIAALVNIYTLVNFPATNALRANALMVHLGFDILQIAIILFLAGGIQNPFVVWLILPSMLAASALEKIQAIAVLAMVVVAITVIAAQHYPLPWETLEGYEWHRVYDVGTWAAMMLGVGFTSSYAYQVTNEQIKISSALEAAEQALAREERLLALGGLAAAAAHELGTPLGTIQVVAREMMNEVPSGPLREDAELLISQTQRCQRILRRLSSFGDNPDARHRVISLEELMREAARPFIDGGAVQIEFSFDPNSQTQAPERLTRRAEIIYGLRTLIENAHKFADQTVMIGASWDDARLTICIEDDGPGISPDVLVRLGEPYSRPRSEAHKAGSKQGLGLGFFIAKTLLERTGAVLTFGNRKERSGAWIKITWPLANLHAATLPSISAVTAAVEQEV